MGKIIASSKTYESDFGTTSRKLHDVDIFPTVDNLETNYVRQTSLFEKIQPIEPLDFHYISDGIEAKSHTPVYKMHKYFARRPYNVMRYLIEAYTQPGEIVLDCFCGGGVTLFEGLATGRKVVAVDVNPLSTFITDCQTTKVSIKDYREIINQIQRRLESLAETFYKTTCRKCNADAKVRWYELAYRVRCPACEGICTLSNANKRVIDEKAQNGRYTCQYCSATITSVDVDRQGYELLSVTYICKCTSVRQTQPCNDNDVAIMNTVEQQFDRMVAEYNLWYPQDYIPEDWDRQQEDCLHRKSIARFSDLYTRRSLLFNAFLLRCIQEYRGKIDDDLYKILIFTFSAIIRHTNNMTISTGNWMDGRPVSWAKHAYWIPNQFVEVNPVEYLEKRSKAICSGMKYQQETLYDVTRVNSFAELLDTGTHAIWTQSSDCLDIPDASVSAVITDPPYGSNVQYGELSHYWLVWLRNELLVVPELFALDQEILVHRKLQSSNQKTYKHYLEGLKSVFCECYRVLKTGGVLVFTFNNKDMKAWYSVTRAAIEAGFYLDDRGIIYQDPIENYRNTAHTRFAGSLHGDFIYTFRKGVRVDENLQREIDQEGDITLAHFGNARDIERIIRELVQNHIRIHGPATTSELYIQIMSACIPLIAKTVESESEIAELNEFFDLDSLDSRLSQYLTFSKTTGKWHHVES